MNTFGTKMSEVTQLKHHNELLAEALSKIIIASGIVRKDIVSFSGPELLFFADDVVRMLETIEETENILLEV